MPGLQIVKGNDMLVNDALVQFQTDSLYPHIAGSNVTQEHIAIVEFFGTPCSTC